MGSGPTETLTHTAGLSSPAGQVGRSGPRRLGRAVSGFPEEEAGPWPWLVELRPFEQGPLVVTSRGAMWRVGSCPGPHVAVTETRHDRLAEAS